MTAKHAGESRIADTALIDQVRAAAADMHDHMARPLPRTAEALADSHLWLRGWAGRAWSLLAQIGEMGE